jgi:hypothetical protein
MEELKQKVEAITRQGFQDSWGRIQPDIVFKA